MGNFYIYINKVKKFNSYIFGYVKNAFANIIVTMSMVFATRTLIPRIKIDFNNVSKTMIRNLMIIRFGFEGVIPSRIKIGFSNIARLIKKTSIINKITHSMVMILRYIYRISTKFDFKILLKLDVNFATFKKLRDWDYKNYGSSNPITYKLSELDSLTIEKMDLTKT